MADWIDVALKLGEIGFNWFINNQNTNNQSDYNKEQYGLQLEALEANLEQLKYNTEADIATTENKLEDAYNNIKLISKNIEVLDYNTALELSRLDTAESKVKGAIFNTSYAGGFLMSQTQSKILEKNTENIEADKTTVNMNREAALADLQTQASNLENFIKIYYGEDKYKELLGEKNTLLDYVSTGGKDIEFDFESAGGYLGQLLKRAKDYENELDEVKYLTHDKTRTISDELKKWFNEDGSLNKEGKTELGKLLLKEITQGYELTEDERKFYTTVKGGDIEAVLNEMQDDKGHLSLVKTELLTHPSNQIAQNEKAKNDLVKLEGSVVQHGGHGNIGDVTNAVDIVYNVGWDNTWQAVGNTFNRWGKNIADAWNGLWGG